MSLSFFDLLDLCPSQDQDELIYHFSDAITWELAKMLSIKLVKIMVDNQFGIYLIQNFEEINFLSPT